MKTKLMYAIILMLIGILFQSCEKNKSDSIELYNGIIILPKNPTVHDEIIIIEEILSCDILRLAIIDENNIEYKRYSDSRIAAPCYLKLDTVSLGQLQEGYYTINYSLIDLAILTSDSIVNTDKFHFYVTGP
ncbi:MAG: hypothetical protein KAG64_05445 [Bacteroidales bacterium]|nr:hypothetical protein [Bacteroidales bacterium]